MTSAYFPANVDDSVARDEWTSFDVFASGATALSHKVHLDLAFLKPFVAVFSSGVG